MTNLKFNVITSIKNPIRRDLEPWTLFHYRDRSSDIFLCGRSPFTNDICDIWVSGNEVVVHKVYKHEIDSEVVIVGKLEVKK